VLVSFGLCLAPSAVLGCPACAARDGGVSVKTLGVLAAMIFVPFVVAGVVIHVIRRLESESHYRA
jgi:hypothetical protein